MDAALKKWIFGIKWKRLPVQQQLIELQKIFREFPSLKTEHLICCILDEALQNPEHQNNFLSILRHLVLAQKVPSSDVLSYISSYKDYSHSHHIKVLLDLADQMVKPLWFHPDQDILASCCSLLRLLHWLVACVHAALQRAQEVNSLMSLGQRWPMPSERWTDIKARAEEQLSNLKAAQVLMEEIMHGRKGILHGLLLIGSAELPEVTSDLLQTAKVSIGLIYRAPLKTIPSDLLKTLLQSVKDCQRLEGPMPRLEQPSWRDSSSTPSCLVQGLVAMAAHLQARSDQRGFLRQLDVLRSHLLMTWEEIVTDLLGACFEGLQHTQHSAERRAEWAAFSFLVIPQMLTLIRDDYSVMELPAVVEKAVRRIMTLYTFFEETEMPAGMDALSLFLCELRLYKIISLEQQKSLQEARCPKAGSLSGRTGSSISQAVARMMASRPEVVEFLQVKNYLPQVQQTVAYSYERMMELGYDSAHHHQNVGLILRTMLQMKNFHFPILAFTGELKNFVQILFKVHDTARQRTYPLRQADTNWTEHFDTSFIMFCALAMDFGPQVILDCREERSMQCQEGRTGAYIWWWIAKGLPWRGKVHDPKQMGSQSPADEVLLAFLARHKPLPAGYASFDKLCWSIPKVMEEMLNAFMNDAVSLEVLQGMLTQLSRLPCSLQLVAGVWLCSHTLQMAEEERARPLAMLDCFLSLPAFHQHRPELVDLTRELLQRVAMPLLPACHPHRQPPPLAGHQQTC